MVGDFQKKVELVGILKHPREDSWDADDYSVVGAMGCFDEKSASAIHRAHKVDGISYKGKNWNATRELIMRETSGRGHGAVLDQSQFVFSIDNLTRASTLFLCGPQYASHLQQSLRRATAERGFFHLDDFQKGSGGWVERIREGNELMEKQFDLYAKMKDGGVPTEDARIILPLNTKTAIQTSWNARELMHLKSMMLRMDVTPDVADTIYKMYGKVASVASSLMKDRGKNYEVLAWMPSSQLFAGHNSTLEKIANEGKGIQMTGFSRGLKMSSEEVRSAVEGRKEALLANMKHYHFSFSVPMSLMTFHQATRQRTWDQSVEPLASAVKRGKYIIPESIAKTDFKEDYKQLCEESIDYVNRNSFNPEFYGVLPHSLEVYDMIHVNGWNAIHSIGKRTCKTAQWEIREKANYMAKKIREVTPEIGKYSLPQGMIYGTCPERENCGACRKL